MTFLFLATLKALYMHLRGLPAVEYRGYRRLFPYTRFMEWLLFYSKLSIEFVIVITLVRCALILGIFK